MMSNRVLIIADDEEMCMELKEILVNEGYEVCVSLDGLSGTELVEKEKFELVILDLKLPELNGYEVLKLVKRSLHSPKVIILSGRPLGKRVVHDQNNLQEESILGLADAVLNKPVVIAKLIDEVHKNTRSNGG